jgi:hypothetical protein
MPMNISVSLLERAMPYLSPSLQERLGLLIASERIREVESARRRYSNNENGFRAKAVDRKRAWREKKRFAQKKQRGNGYEHIH